MPRHKARHLLYRPMLVGPLLATMTGNATADVAVSVPGSTDAAGRKVLVF